MVTAFPICNRYNVADFKFRNPFKDSHETAPRTALSVKRYAELQGDLQKAG